MTLEESKEVIPMMEAMITQIPNVDAGAGNSCPTSNRRSSYSRVLLMICVKHRK